MCTCSHDTDRYIFQTHALKIICLFLAVKTHPPKPKRAKKTNLRLKKMLGEYTTAIFNASKINIWCALLFKF